MTAQTTIDNLKAAFQEIEEEKLQIDDVHHAFMIVLCYFEEENPDVSRNDSNVGIESEGDTETL